MKKFIYFSLFLILAASELSLASGENYRISLNTLYYTKKDETQLAGGSTTSDVKTLYNDLEGGFIFNGLYAGVLYGADSVETAVTATITKKELLNHWAASVGYVGHPWFFIFNYMLTGTYIPTDSQLWSQLSGYQLEGGYDFQLSGSFNLGLQLTYRKLEYKKYEISGNSQSNADYIRTEIYPMIDLTFLF